MSYNPVLYGGRIGAAFPNDLVSQYKSSRAKAFRQQMLTRPANVPPEVWARAMRSIITNVFPESYKKFAGMKIRGLDGLSAENFETDAALTDLFSEIAEEKNTAYASYLDGLPVYAVQSRSGIGSLEFEYKKHMLQLARLGMFGPVIREAARRTDASSLVFKGKPAQPSKVKVSGLGVIDIGSFHDKIAKAFTTTVSTVSKGATAAAKTAAGGVVATAKAAAAVAAEAAKRLKAALAEIVKKISELTDALTKLGNAKAEKNKQLVKAVASKKKADDARKKTLDKFEKVRAVDKTKPLAEVKKMSYIGVLDKSTIDSLISMGQTVKPVCKNGKLVTKDGKLVCQVIAKKKLKAAYIDKINAKFARFQTTEKKKLEHDKKHADVVKKSTENDGKASQAADEAKKDVADLHKNAGTPAGTKGLDDIQFAAIEAGISEIGAPIFPLIILAIVAILILIAASSAAGAKDYDGDAEEYGDEEPDEPVEGDYEEAEEIESPTEETTPSTAQPSAPTTAPRAPTAPATVPTKVIQPAKKPAQPPAEEEEEEEDEDEDEDEEEGTQGFDGLEDLYSLDSGETDGE